MGDTATIEKWASIRMAVGSALFLTYFFYYLAYHFAHYKQNQKPKSYVQISELGSKMYLFGGGCLLSINYSQASIYQTIFTYFTMVAIFVVILLTIFDSISQTLRVGANFALYILLVMWYMGIIIDYGITLNSN